MNNKKLNKVIQQEKRKENCMTKSKNLNELALIFSEGEDRNLLSSEARLEISEGGWTSPILHTGDRLRKTETEPSIEPPPEFLSSLSSLRNSTLPFGEGKNHRKAAFTLAEVLITLAVIGIVAALTLPGLIQNHNEKAWSTAKDLWEKKLTETVRRMNTDGVMTGHDSTEDFMDTFKQYMKVIKTCDNTDINKCYSPKVVTTGSNEEPMEVETDSLTSASSMGLKDWQTNTNTMSFVVVDGTTVIMAYQPECPYADPTWHTW